MRHNNRIAIRINPLCHNGFPIFRTVQRHRRTVACPSPPGLLKGPAQICRKTGLSIHRWGYTLTGSLWEIFCRNGFCVSGSWHMARSPRTNTLPGRSTGLILLIAVPIPSITWTGANKNKDKQNSSAEFVVQQGCLLILCNNTRLYQADAVSIISVS